MASNYKSVEKEAFLNQTTITAVSFGKDCKTVEESAFKNCSELSNINDDNVITTIGDSAFEGCKCLKSITINNNCSFIGDYAFKDCESLTTVNIPNNENFKIISNGTFQNCSINEISIPKYITTIGSNAFNSCGKLSAVTFDSDSHVVNIGNFAFNACSSIKSISIPNTTTNIGYGAFRECKSLTSAIIGNSVTNIQGEAFNGCIGLTNINIPNSVTTIGKVAFARCSGLTTISIGYNVKNIGNDAFKGCNKIGSIYISNIASWCGINFENEYANPLIYSTTSTYLYENNEKLTDIDIPNNVSNIKSNVFYNYKNLNRIILPSAVSSIGNNAFNGCENLKTVINLTSLSIIKGNEDNGNVATYASRVVKGTSRINDFIFNKESNKNNELVYHLKSDVTDIRLPSHTNGKYDISDSVFVEHTKLTKFTIPNNTVASIGKRVFEDCKNLTDVSIGDGVTNIGNGTFKNCGITSMTIPNTVTNIGNEVFNGCSLLTELNIKDNDDGSSDSEPPIIEIGVEPDTSNNNNPLNLGYNILNNNSREEGKGLFKDCPIEKLHLGRNLTYESDKKYGYSPFTNISSLTSVTIGNSVTSIGEYAFSGCRNIKEVYISDLAAWCNIDFADQTSNPLYYANNLFLNGDLIKDIVIPEGVENIKNYTFCNYDGLTSITIPQSVDSIGNWAFAYCDGLTSVTIPNSVTSIGQGAFNSCDGLTSVTIGNSVERIGEDAFNGCSYMKTYVDGSNIPPGWCKINFANGGANPASISGGLHNIENEDYDDEKNKPIENIIIPNGVEKIGSYAFYNFKYTKSIIIPNDVGVTNIGEGAFKNCDNNIKRIVIGNGVETIGKHAFSNIGNVDIIIIGQNTPLINGDIYTANYWLHTPIIINFSNNDYTSTGFFGNISISSSNKYYSYPPNDTRILDGFMFNSYTLCGYMGDGVGKLTLPNYYNDNTYKIGDYVFYNCDMLTEITIPNYITEIGIQAFCGCSGLEGIVVDAGNENYDSRNNCNAIITKKYIETQKIGANTLIQGCKNTRIPDGVTTIGNHAFYNCDTLTSITIPSSVKKIEEDAFWGCKNLKTVINHSEHLSIANDDLNGYVGKYADVITNHNDTTIEIYKGFVFNINEKTLISYSGNETELVLPENYKGYEYKIGNQAFWNNKNITSVIISNSVTSIGESAFEGCDALKTVINLSSHLTIEKGSVDNGYVGKYADKVINAPNGSIEGDFVFDKPNGVNTLVAYIGNDKEITLPSNYNGENYVIGESSFENNKTITKIIIPYRVTSIGYNAFLGCDNLKTVINHSSSFTIEKGSVDNGYVGKYADTVENTYIQLDENFVFEVSEGVNILKSYKGTEQELVLPTSYYGENYVIGESAFYENTTITSITIPNSVTSIGNYAFWKCNSLTSVTIGNGVTSVGHDAFNLCSNLKMVNISNITNWCNIDFGSGNSNPLDYANNLYLNGELIKYLVIPEGVKTIKYCVFNNCTNLINVTIPNSVTSIGGGAFYGCTSLTNITIPNSVTNIGEVAFDKTTWYNNQPDGIVYVGKVLYKYKGDMSENTSFNIADNTLGIAEGAFEKYSGLTSITIPNSVTNIGDYAFYGCENLKTVINFSKYFEISAGSEKNGWVGYYAEKIINSNTTITNCTTEGDFVFGIVDNKNTLCAHIGDIDGDTELTLPANYKGENYVIGVSAFENCVGLISVTIPNSVTSIGDYAFKNCTKNSDIDYNGLQRVIFEDGSNLESIGVFAFNGCDYIKSIEIPNSVTNIGSYTFSGCSSLKSITLPTNISTISRYMFENCDSLNNIIIPNSTTSIEEFAFYHCIRLTSVTIGDSVTSIGDEAFCNCSSLTSVTFGNSVKNIGKRAFYNCNDLENIEMPNSVTTIDGEAFSNCQKLKNVKIGNSEDTQIKYINTKAFYNPYYKNNYYTVLESVYIYAKEEPYIGENIFFIGVWIADGDKGYYRTKIYVPKDGKHYNTSGNVNWHDYYDESMIKKTL